jgi:hypothetical protein
VRLIDYALSPETMGTRGRIAITARPLHVVSGDGSVHVICDDDDEIAPHYLAMMDVPWGHKGLAVPAPYRLLGVAELRTTSTSGILGVTAARLVAVFSRPQTIDDAMDELDLPT